MTTFALIAGMMPVAIGVGEGGEFYSPMAVAIIGGTIVSTMLTLLVVPSFYDSIEIATSRASAKMHARADLGNPALAFALTVIEALLTLLGIRALYRGICAVARIPRREHPVLRASRMTGEPTPRGWEAPKAKTRVPIAVAVNPNPYAPRPAGGD
jgi:hypothetical protein